VNTIGPDTAVVASRRERSAYPAVTAATAGPAQAAELTAHPPLWPRGPW
jgi:hypothetical protein